MDSDPVDNQGSPWEWFPWELVGNTTSIDGVIQTPDQPLPQQSPVNMAGTSNNINLEVNSSNTGTQNLPATEDPREKKKRADKAYRDRCRERQKKQEEELDILGAENARLKNENESLTEDKDSASRRLDLAANALKELRREKQKLELTGDHQKILVDAFTEKFASQAHADAENLKKKVAVLRSENVNIALAIEEKKRLHEERLKLEHENMLLELQNKAYCMMIQNGSRNPADQDQD